MRKNRSKDAILDPIVAALRDARAAKGLSQRALSERAAMPQSQISRIESGEVDLQLSTLIGLARTLDLEVKLVPRASLPAVTAVINARADSEPRPAYSLLDDEDGQP